MISKIQEVEMRLLMIILITLGLVSTAFATDVVGKWRTIDDETGKPKSIVEIYEKEGLIYGKVLKTFPKEGGDPDPICDKCKDYRKDQKIIGMEIITGLKKDGDKYGDGEILDPKKGKIYDCELWKEGEKLKVRGYVAFFFRTQTWEPFSE